MDSMMPGKGQVRRTTRLEPEVGVRQAKPPWVNHDMAGRRMTSAAEGVDGIKGQIMHTAIPSSVGFCQSSLEQGSPHGSNVLCYRRRCGQFASGSGLNSTDATSLCSISPSTASRGVATSCGSG